MLVYTLDTIYVSSVLRLNCSMSVIRFATQKRSWRKRDPLLWSVDVSFQEKHDLPLNGKLFDSSRDNLHEWFSTVHAAYTTLSAENSRLVVSHATILLSLEHLLNPLENRIQGRARNDEAYSWYNAWFISYKYQFPDTFLLPFELHSQLAVLQDEARLVCIQYVVAEIIFNAAASASYETFWLLNSFTAQVWGKKYATPLLAPMKFSVPVDNTWRNLASKQRVSVGGAEVPVEKLHTVYSSLSRANNNIDEFIQLLWCKLPDTSKVISDTTSMVQMFIPGQTIIDIYIRKKDSVVQQYIRSNFSLWWKQLCKERSAMDIALPASFIVKTKGNNPTAFWQQDQFGDTLLFAVGFMMFYEAAQSNSDKRQGVRSHLCTLTEQCFGSAHAVPKFDVGCVLRMCKPLGAAVAHVIALVTKSINTISVVSAALVVSSIATCATSSAITSLKFEDSVRSQMIGDTAITLVVHGILRYLAQKRNTVPWLLNCSFILNILVFFATRNNMGPEFVLRFVEYGLTLLNRKFSPEELPLMHGTVNNFSAVVAAAVVGTLSAVDISSSKKIVATALLQNVTGFLPLGAEQSWRNRSRSGCLMIRDASESFTAMHHVSNASTLRLWSRFKKDQAAEKFECVQLIESFLQTLGQKVEINDAIDEKFTFDTAVKASQYPPETLNTLASFWKDFFESSADASKSMKNLCYYDSKSLPDLSFVEKKTKDKGAYSTDITFLTVPLVSSHSNWMTTKYKWSMTLKKGEAPDLSSAFQNGGKYSLYSMDDQAGLAAVVLLLLRGMLFSSGSEQSAALGVAKNTRLAYWSFEDANSKYFEGETFPTLKVIAATLNELAKTGIAPEAVDQKVIWLMNAAYRQESELEMDKNLLDKRCWKVYREAKDMMIWRENEANIEKRFLALLAPHSKLCNTALSHTGMRSQQVGRHDQGQSTMAQQDQRQISDLIELSKATVHDLEVLAYQKLMSYKGYTTIPTNSPLKELCFFPPDVVHNANLKFTKVSNGFLLPFQSYRSDIHSAAYYWAEKIHLLSSQVALSTVMELLLTGMVFSAGADDYSKQVSQNAKTLFKNLQLQNKDFFIEKRFPVDYAVAAMLIELAFRKVAVANVSWLVSLTIENPEPSNSEIDNKAWELKDLAFAMSNRDAYDYHEDQVIIFSIEPENHILLYKLLAPICFRCKELSVPSQEGTLKGEGTAGDSVPNATSAGFGHTLQGHRQPGLYARSCFRRL